VSGKSYYDYLNHNFFPVQVPLLMYLIVIANEEGHYECTYGILYMQELGGDDGQCSPPKAWRNMENNALMLRNRLVSAYQ
jgi:hypothetical protein